MSSINVARMRTGCSIAGTCSGGYGGNMQYSKPSRILVLGMLLQDHGSMQPAALPKLTAWQL